MQYQEEGVVLRNRRMQTDYFRIDMHAPNIANEAAPGQFVHVRIPTFTHRLLRRPFSVFSATPDDGTLSVIYKIVGEGTRHLATVSAEQTVDLLGPLGKGFTLCEQERQSIIVAGGYGCAATYLLAVRAKAPPLCLLGGRSQEDILLVDQFKALGCEVRVSTDDGSVGHKGLVTDLLGTALDAATPEPDIFACGPTPMLRAVANILSKRGLDGELSMDHVMCCGVGACFACVIKLTADTPEGWQYIRTCREGPVFKASQVVWE